MSEVDTPPNNSSGEDRQFVHFSFYALAPEFRRLPAIEQEAARAELQGVIDEAGERFPIRAYTMHGIRPDADLMKARTPSAATSAEPTVK